MTVDHTSLPAVVSVEARNHLFVGQRSAPWRVSQRACPVARAGNVPQLRGKAPCILSKPFWNSCLYLSCVFLISEQHRSFSPWLSGHGFDGPHGRPHVL